MFLGKNFLPALFTQSFSSTIGCNPALFAVFSKIDPMDLYRIGDCPNIETKTLGGKTFWRNLKIQNGLRLQQNIITGLCRILDENNIRKAWGNRFSMEEKLKRLTRDNFLEAGDIIGIDRKFKNLDKLSVYQHYAIYIGNNRVIHYQGNGNDFSGKITIHESPISDFLKSDENCDKNCFVLLFDEDEKNVVKLRTRTEFTEAEVLDCSIFNDSKFTLYSSEQTIKRANELLEEENYSLLLRNCEHIAVWCKTNVSCSFQVKRILKWIEIAGELAPLALHI